MEKEAKFNAKKMVRSAAEVFIQGGALPSERRHLAPLAAAHREHRAKAIKQRQRADKRKADAMAPVQSIALRDKPLYIDRSAFPVAPAEIAPIITKNRMPVKEDVVLAPGGVFVVDNPGQPPRSVRWVAILSGAAIVNKEYFVSATAHGSCMAWLPAITVQRVLWLSGNVKAAEPLFAELIAWACRLPASNWQLRSDTWDEDTYIAKQRKVVNLLGVVTTTEKSGAKFGHRKTMVCDDFLKYVEKFDPSVSGFKSEAAPARSSCG